jgi:hypothetical protein
MTGRSCFWEVQDEDGKGIVMRREGLREGTKRAAERESHRLKTRLSPGEKRNRKRMATVATVYSIERQVRTPESVMGREKRGRRAPASRTQQTGVGERRAYHRDGSKPVFTSSAERIVTHSHQVRQLLAVQQQLE